MNSVYDGVGFLLKETQATAGEQHAQPGILGVARAKVRGIQCGGGGGG